MVRPVEMWEGNRRSFNGATLLYRNPDRTARIASFATPLMNGRLGKTETRDV